MSGFMVCTNGGYLMFVMVKIWGVSLANVK